MAPGLGDMLRGLFGGGQAGGRTGTSAAPAPAEPVEYNGYVIVPAPRQDKGMWYVSGSITPADADDDRTHSFIRADNSPDRDQCIELTVMKARQIIDLEGERMFARGSDPAVSGG